MVCLRKSGRTLHVPAGVDKWSSALISGRFGSHVFILALPIARSAGQR